MTRFETEENHYLLYRCVGESTCMIFLASCTVCLGESTWDLPAGVGKVLFSSIHENHYLLYRCVGESTQGHG
jgi:hypothetical protein